MQNRSIHSAQMLTAWVAMFFALPIFATTYWVDGERGDDGNSGTSRESAFKTIQKAFDTEEAGLGDDEIIICSGEYPLTETIHINAYCTVRGETGNPADVVIRRSGTVKTARFAGTVGAKLGKRLLVHGLTFGDDRAKKDSSDESVDILSGAVVSNCVFCGCGVADDPVKYYAVQVEDGGQLSCSIVSNCVSSGNCSAVCMRGSGVMDHCLVTDCHTPSIAGGAVEGYSGGIVSDCVISNNTGKLGSAFYGDCQMLSNTVFACNTVSFTTSSRLSGTLNITQVGDGLADGMKIFGCHIVDNKVTGASCGGLYAGSVSALEVVDTEIARNEAEGNYGGVYAQGSAVTFCNCTIRDNKCGGLGGGLGGTFTIEGGVVEGNEAVTGGGICVLTNGTATAKVSGVRILSNVASGSGGGVAIGGAYKSGEASANVGWALIEDCLISNNVANAAKSNDAGGGGVWFKPESLSAGIVSRCRIVDNRATTAHGGGILVRGLSSGDARGSIDVRSCFFKGNSAKENGGAINAISYPPLMIDNCTLAGNVASGNGNGLYIRWTGAKVRNSIVVAADMYSDSTMNKGVYFHNCCIPVSSLPACAPESESNIASDPGFADADAGDYSLAKNSPCIDVGEKLDWMDDSSRDIAGNRRVWVKGSGIPDIGAWEFKYPMGMLLQVR